MVDSETRLIRNFGRAFRMVEAWVEAGLLDDIREVTDVAFGDSPEHRLVRVLTSARDALPLYEISIRCRTSRRAVLGSGRLRLALERMEESGILVNKGTHQRPRYQLNLKDDKARLVVSLFLEGGEANTLAPVSTSYQSNFT
ncbi:MAG: hypothetical protein OK452_09855 [Thaumarchaeota archaeon]|nr:hypothetical protein [Nitrososphaerota archaeon]